MARKTRALLTLVLLTAACGGRDTPTMATRAAEQLDLRLQTDHFRILAGRVSDDTVRRVADRLERQFPRVTADLAATGVATVTVKIWQDEPTFAAEMERYFGQRYPATGYITGRDEIRVLEVPQLAVNAIHEFCHAVSLYLSPAFANNPRWLWEAVALFENEEFVPPRSLAYLTRGAYPTLQQLNADPNASRQIYEVGYVLGEFIVSRWGHDAFLQLIRSNGDLQGVLGVSAPAFEDAWFRWMQERYLS